MLFLFIIVWEITIISCWYEGEIWRAYWRVREWERGVGVGERGCLGEDLIILERVS